jgi:hypothetical protein
LRNDVCGKSYAEQSTQDREFHFAAIEPKPLDGNKVLPLKGESDAPHRFHGFAGRRVCETIGPWLAAV